MQTARLLNDVNAWAQIQMIGITENYLCFYVFFQLLRMHTFDRAERTNGHKNRRLNVAVRRFYRSSTGFTEGVGVV